jgi:hypothetical protein
MDTIELRDKIATLALPEDEVKFSADNSDPD